MCKLAINIVLCFQLGRSPLHEVAAIFWNEIDIVEALINAGADVNAVDKVSYYQVPN